MSDLENDFGPYAFYVEALQGKTFDIPEALTDALFRLAQAGLWNLPNGGKYEAVVQARTWNSEYTERVIRSCGVSPSALRNAFTKYEEAFVTTAWEKFDSRFEYKFRLCSSLLAEPNRFHPDLERIGKEARAMRSTSDVLRSGIVTEFCEAILNRELAVLIGSAFSRDSYTWLNELALYLLPIQESIEFLEDTSDDDDDLFLDVLQPENMRLITAAIDEEILKRWGDDDVVANMRHQSNTCKGMWIRSWDNSKEFSPDPLCKVCVLDEEIRKATTALYEELRQKGIHIFSWNPTFKSVEEVAAYREEVLASNEEMAKTADEFVSQEQEILEEEVDPFVEDVIYLVEGLTKLGVSPNKAAEVASKLMTSPTS